MSEKKLRCGMCFGVGSWPRTCNRCKGKDSSDNDSPVQCESCKGTGQVARPCLYCDGTGEYLPGRTVQGLMSFVMVE